MVDEVSPTQKQVALLKAKVYALVRTCPAGRVTTYGWIGKALGYPRGARMIGWIMNEAAEGVPAQRVISSKGELTGSWAFGQHGGMRQLLEVEGIVFSNEGRVDLKRYGWDPSRDLDEEQLKRILDAADNSNVAVSERLLFLLRNDVASPLRETPTN
ncbi:MAG TPA: MGMT family protein [Ktedonobacteraceae bacterium]|nr:MGMT family protein [Ktedonobacteraceae bacterium]